MDSKLDRFFPSPETVAGVKRQLINAGIAPESIPQDWLAAIIAAQTKWQATTVDGSAFVVNSLGFQWTTGRDEFQYDFHDPNSMDIYKLKSDQVHFFAGAAVNGHPVNPTSIVASKRTTLQCEGCGIVSHCVKTVRDPSRDRLETLCNTCICHHEFSKVQDLGERDLCQRCTSTDCYHHPQPKKAIRA